MAAKRKVRRRKPAKNNQAWALLAGMGLFAFSFAASLWPDSFGIVGERFLVVFSYVLGKATPAVSLLLAISLAFLLTSRKDRHRISLGFMLLSLAAVALWQFALPETSRLTNLAKDGSGGGLIGWFAIWGLSFVGSSGTILVLALLIAAALLAITGASVQKVVSTSIALIYKAVASVAMTLWSFLTNALAAPEQSGTRKKTVRKPREAAHESLADRASDPFDMPEPMPEIEPAQQMPEPEPPRVPRRVPEEAVATDGNAEQLRLPSPPYAPPSLNILNRGLRQPGGKGSREERENIRTLEETLSNFGISARVVDVTRGPTYTRYEIQTAPGTKVSKVKALSNDITMSLASEDVRIEAPIPGKAAIGIEVPNKARTAVTLRDVVDSPEFESSTSPLTVALGKDIEGNTVVADLSQMPHLLIAGATGAGKSVCINSIICSILFRSSPDQVKFMLVDPKVVELATYNGIPHLLAPVLNHPKKAAAALKWAVQEMERRYALFAKTGVRDIERYNELMGERGDVTMAQVVIIIDELADLMMVARAEVEDAICRLAQMARAAGMHLVVGTQRPSTDVITGLIKANIPSRLSFTVSSATDSRVILDVSGAEKLLGRGDMLFLPVGWTKPKRIQGAFVSNHEIEKIVDHVSAQGEAQYVQALNTMEEYDSAQSDGDVDERFEEAVRVVVEAGQASVSMLQRRMRLGYTRAARIVDQMFEQGIVGPSEGSKPRQVNKNKDIVKAIMEKKQT
jgi:S-DNA-T family DNA segregation ATPase FtsK/SpoIIIE